MSQIDIQLITHLPAQIRVLEKEAVGEGFRFLTRLINEWHSGTNRFNAPGECLLAVTPDRTLPRHPPTQTIDRFAPDKIWIREGRTKPPSAEIRALQGRS